MSRYFRLAARTAMLLGLTLSLSNQAFAQPTGQSPVAPAAPNEAFTPAVGGDPLAQTTMLQLQNVLRQYPPSVGQVLQLDPSLLSRPDYLAPYPRLAAFLAQHPEVVRNPQFYFGEFHERQNVGGVAGVARAFEDSVWVLIPLGVFLFMAWLIKQLVDHRRWLSASKTEWEVHTKLLDRMTNNVELLSYLESPAGRRLFEGALAPGDTRAPQRVAAPTNRILWSIQLGVIIAMVGTAVWLLTYRINDTEAAEAIFGMGVIVTTLGCGFIVSALISWALSLRLGLMRAPQSQP